MKRALITIATVGILAPTAWVAGANAQYGSPAPPAYSPSPTYAPSPRYTRRAYRRAYRRSPSQTYAGGPTVYTPGSGPPPYSVSQQTYAAQSSGPWEWHAGPGPMKRGNQCVTHVDLNRGYGFMGPCKK